MASLSVLIALCGLGQPLVATAGEEPPRKCVGDCAIDGHVTVDEIITGVSIALGETALEGCLMFDSSRDGAVTVDEILASVTAALDGCVPNQAPASSDLPDYLTYPGQAVEVVLPGSDPDNDSITFSATGLPAGAALDSETGVLTWNPIESDVGPYSIEYEVTDDGLPSLSAPGTLQLEVLQSDSCLALNCDPATGCTSMPVEIETNCCPAPRPTRSYAPLTDCPDGARIEVGRNFSGFGPLQNCDALPLQSIGQGGTRVSMHFAVRCLRTTSAVALRVQLFIPELPLANQTQSSIAFVPFQNGFAGRRNMTFTIDDSTIPPSEFEGDEAQLLVTVQDADGLLVEKKLRLRLTLGTAADIPDDENSPGVP